MHQSTFVAKATKVGTVTALALTAGVSLDANASQGWTPWVSEEGGNPPTYREYTSEAARGFDCSESVCVP